MCNVQIYTYIYIFVCVCVYKRQYFFLRIPFFLILLFYINIFNKEPEEGALHCELHTLLIQKSKKTNLFSVIWPLYNKHHPAIQEITHC